MFDKFIENFNIDTIPDVFKSCYDEACAEIENKGVFFLEKDYIISVQERTSAFGQILDNLISEAEKVKQDKNAALYALFLYKSMLRRSEFISNFSSFKLLSDYPLFAFLCLIPTIENTFNTLKKKDLPQDAIEATMSMYQDCTYYEKCATGKVGLSETYFSWLQRYVDCKILQIDRLRFEIKPFKDPVYVLQSKSDKHLKLLFDGGKMNSNGMYLDTPPSDELSFATEFNETADAYFGNEVSADGKCTQSIKELRKNEYTLALKKGDIVLSVHIPGENPFTKELCDKSYNRAKEIFTEYFPELDIKAFTCHSWMLSSELNDILKPTSNILKFKEKYTTYPIKTEGKDVFNFVFNNKFTTYEDLPENTSLQKAIKKIYLSGGYIYEYGGVALL